MDNTKGTKSNRVTLNLAHVHGAMEPPEPGIAAVFIDGVPIHAPDFIQVTAAIGQTTMVTIRFEAEVSGTLGGKSVADMLKEMRDR